LVLDHMASARLVVLRAGPGHGLFWELRESFSQLAPEKFVVLILNMQSRDYQSFAKEVRENFGLALPSLTANSLWKGVVDVREASRVAPGFVTFAPDWTPQFLPIPFKVVRLGYNDLRGPLSEALKPVFASQGLTWHRIGRL
jgi:hypothetical protein